MNISRRDLLKFAVGSAAGIMLTPVPWKVLDDSAIWTQNWPWIPVPPKGESTTRFTTCTLCPAGCGIRARCISGQPVSLAGVAEHPLSGGTLCPIGFGAHHLAYHPMRVAGPLRRSQKFGALDSRPLLLDEAIDAVAGAINSRSVSESVAVLDRQPGRAVSILYQRLCARVPGGIYLRAPRVEDATLATSASMMGVGEESLGFDLENARMLVSFGAPLFDGWGTPGRMMDLAGRRSKKGSPKILQIETRQSRTALQADSWIPIRPGTEGTLALGLAHVLVAEKLCTTSRLRAAARDFEGNGSGSFMAVLMEFTPEAVSTMTGVGADRIRSIARSMATEGPTVVLGAGDPAGGPLRPEDNLAIASLNFLLDGVGHKGGVITRRNLATLAGNDAAAPVLEIQEVPDRSIRVLLLDAAESGHALPWSLIERKLADEKALVVSLSPYAAGLSRHAEIIIPSPACFESLQDVPAPFDAPHATFSLSAPLLNPSPGAVEPAEVVRKIAAALGIVLEAQDASPSDRMKAHVQALYSSGRGSVFTPSDRKTTPVKEMESSDRLWITLMEGGCWVDDPVTASPPARLSFLEGPGITAERMRKLAGECVARHETRPALTLVPYGWRGASGTGQVSPLMSKLYQESGLRSTGNHAMVNPGTGKAQGMSDDAPMTLETAAGSTTIHVHFDASVMPDLLLVAVGPDATAINAGNAGDASDLLSMCLSDDGRSWRMIPAKVSTRTA